MGLFVILGMDVRAGEIADLTATLATGTHRQTGSHLSAKIETILRSGLEIRGIDEVLVHEFPFPRLKSEQCQLTDIATGRSLNLYPMRPNGILPSVTPDGGLYGRLIDGRNDAQLSDWTGALVVLSYNSDESWRRAFRLGARAVIFVGGEVAESRQILHTTARVLAPRFYFSGDPDVLPWGKEVRLDSQVTWGPSTGRSVLGIIRARKDSPLSEEIVVISVARDTYGEVPDLAPGARLAANMAVLLELGRSLEKNRPERTIVLAFMDGESRGFSGSTEFYRLLTGKGAKDELATRHASFEAESQLLGDVKSALPGNVSFAENETTDPALRRRLQAVAFDFLQSAQEKRRLLRHDAPDVDKNLVLTDELDHRIQQLNDLRRDLHSGIKVMWSGVSAEVFVEARNEMARRAEELVVERRCLLSDEAVWSALGTGRIVAHLSLDLGDTTSRWALLFGGDSAWHSPEDAPGLYGRMQAAAFDAWRSIARERGTDLSFEVASVNGRLPPGDTLWGGGLLVHSGEAAGLFGVPNAVLGTVQEGLSREGTPDDTVASLGLNAIEEQAEGVIPFLNQFLSDERLGGRSLIRPRVRSVMAGMSPTLRVVGPQVWMRNLGASVSSRAVPGVIIQYEPTPMEKDRISRVRHAPGFDDFRVTRSDSNGAYRIAATVFEEGKDESYGVRFDQKGWPIAATTTESLLRGQARLNLVSSWHGWLPDGAARAPVPLKLMDSRGQSALDPRRSLSGLRDGFGYWFVENAVKGVNVFEADTAVMLGEDRQGLGRGVFAQSAEALWRLDDQRLSLLHSRGISLDSVQTMHQSARELDIAGAGTEAGKAMSFWFSGPIYREVMATLNDLVIAVLFLLFLAIPFAYAVERLVFGATSIYRQVAGFSAVFVAAFLVLFLTHPAFALSSAPLIIFLGFSILLLSGTVIVLLMRRFENEFRSADGMAANLHDQSVSRAGAIFAAMAMGISTMRRRPMRTILTAITVFFLTFTILVFASFSRSIGVTRIFDSTLPSYDGILAYRPGWIPLSDKLTDLLPEQWPNATVVGRYWLAQERLGGQTWLLSREDGAMPVSVSGVLGLESAEIKARPDLAAIFIDPAKNDPVPPVWLTQATAELLDLRVGDQLLLAGEKVRLAAIVSRSSVGALSDLGGASPLPVDFISLNEGQAPQRELDSSREPPHPQNPISADLVAVTSSEVTKALGAPLRAVAVYDLDRERLADVAKDLAVALQVPVAVTLTDGVYWQILGVTVQAAGVGDMIIPILLGGLVILGTMLGSVVDRQREIYTFSALGLAPSHITGLFLAEAGVYAITGGFSGYLGAQVLAKVGAWMAGIGWIPELDLNHSSFNAMISLIVVMATVMGSAVYPAFRASRSANPGLARQFRMPPMQGDIMVIDFPFTVSGHDFVGILRFLAEHFERLADASLGRFQSLELSVDVKASGRILRAKVALKPYDLGVTQTIELADRPSEIEGVSEISIQLQRLSGEPKNWWRLNRTFLDEIRKQLLLWRALSPAVMDSYRTGRDSNELPRKDGHS